MTGKEIVFQMFRRVIWKHLRGFLGPLGGLLGASWRLLGGLLQAPWGPSGGSGGRFYVNHHFETFEISGRAVLKPSWGRFLVFLGHFGVILEVFLITIATANSTCKIDVLLAFWALRREFSGFSDARKHCVLWGFWLLEAISIAYLQWNRKIDLKIVFENVVVSKLAFWWPPGPVEPFQKAHDHHWVGRSEANFLRLGASLK